MKKTNLKKILSCIMAASMLPAVVTSVSAKPISKTETLLSQDFETLGEGFSLDTALTDEQLAQLGFVLETLNFPEESGKTAVKPKAVIKHVSYPSAYQGGKETNVLCLEINKNTPFTLKKSITIPSGIDLNSIDIDYIFRIQDKSKYEGPHDGDRVAFTQMGSLIDSQGTAVITPYIEKSQMASFLSFMKKEGLTSSGKGHNCYRTWVKHSYNINYDENKANTEFFAITNDNGAQAGVDKIGTCDITSDSVPAELQWTTNLDDVMGLNSITDESNKIYLYIDDINVSAKYDELDSLKCDGTVLFNGVDKDSKLTSTVVYNNSYTATPLLSAKSFTTSDAIELPNDADRVGAQFSNVNAEDGKAKIIVARYTEDTNGTKKLTNATVSDVTVKNGTATSDKFLDLTSGSGEIVQAYIWDGFEKITPLANIQKATFAQAGSSTIFNMDFENYDIAKNTDTIWSNNEDGSAIKMSPGDGDAFKHEISNDVNAVSGEKTLKIACSSKSGSVPKNRVRLKGSNASTLDTEYQNNKYTAEGEAKALYRVSMYVKASKDMSLGVWLDSSGRNGTNWNAVYTMIDNIPVKANNNNWQKIVVYTDFAQYDVNMAGKKDSITLNVTTDEAQDVYFDNIVVEKVK